MYSKCSKVGYVVKRYPRFSETFVVNEILAHEAAGVPLEIFSLRPPVDTHFQDLISRVKSPLTYLSCGQVKANELWDAMARCHETIRNAFECLQDAEHEAVLDVYCGLQLATHAVERGLTHLHAHFASSAASAARIASKLTGIPYSITAHAKDIFHDSVCVKDLAVRIQDSACTFTVSDFNLNYLQRSFPQCADRIVRLYNGIHLDDFSFRSPYHRPSQIVAVGRFVEKKGFADLIEACALLRARNVEFNCVLIGGGDLELSLRQQIQRQQLSDHVRMLGPCPQREVKQLIQQSAVMAAPCVHGADGNRDGLPTVLLESMALGTPCVSTDVTGIPEIVLDDETGLIVDQNSPDRLADALQRMLHDASLRTRLAVAARGLIERNFDIVLNAAHQRSVFANSTGFDTGVEDRQHHTGHSRRIPAARPRVQASASHLER